MLCNNDNVLENYMRIWKLDNALYRIILGCGVMLEIELWFGNRIQPWILGNVLDTGWRWVRMWIYIALDIGYCFGYWIVRGKLDNASDFGMIIWDIE